MFVLHTVSMESWNDFSIYDFQRVNIIRKIHATVKWSCCNTARHSGHLFRDEQRAKENLTKHEQFANYSTLESANSLITR